MWPVKDNIARLKDRLANYVRKPSTILLVDPKIVTIIKHFFFDKYYQAYCNCLGPSYFIKYQAFFMKKSLGETGPSEF